MQIANCDFKVRESECFVAAHVFMLWIEKSQRGNNVNGMQTPLENRSEKPRVSVVGQTRGLTCGGLLTLETYSTLRGTPY